jgi:hypothetical protein
MKYLTEDPYRYDRMQANERGVAMAYRYGDRYQMVLFPRSIEEYIPDDHPVRVYDAFVEALDFNALGIEIDSHQVGNSEYDPKAMIKLLVYGSLLWDQEFPETGAGNALQSLFYLAYGRVKTGP